MSQHCSRRDECWRGRRPKIGWGSACLVVERVHVFVEGLDVDEPVDEPEVEIVPAQQSEVIRATLQEGGLHLLHGLSTPSAAQRWPCAGPGRDEIEQGSRVEQVLTIDKQSGFVQQSFVCKLFFVCKLCIAVVRTSHSPSVAFCRFSSSDMALPSPFSRALACETIRGDQGQSSGGWPVFTAWTF